MKLLLYCTKNKWRLFFDKVKQVFTLGKVKSNNDLNGKIVAECDFEVKWESTDWYCNDFIEYKGLEKSCLTKKQLFDYVKGRDEFYAIHIKNLHIFDGSKKLSEFDVINFRCIQNYYKPLENVPRNIMYVYDNGEKKIIIPVSPQEMCRIANKEQTILIRRRMVKTYDSL